MIVIVFCMSDITQHRRRKGGGFLKTFFFKGRKEKKERNDTIEMSCAPGLSDGTVPADRDRQKDKPHAPASVSASNSASASGRSAHTWVSGCTASADLEAYRLPLVSAALDEAIDVQRSSSAIDWAMEAGVGSGHVLVLYKLARNGLKWSGTGRVPSGEELSRSMFLGLALLLRVAQDVQACVTDMARPSRAWIFEAFCCKVSGWVRQWHVESLPELPPITAQVLAWAARRDTWPNPAWAAAFSCPMLVGTKFTFAEPSLVDVAAFDRCKTLASTRADVLGRMRDALRDVTVWDSALTRRLAGLVKP